MNKEDIAKAHEIFHAKTGIDISISIDKALREILEQQRQDIIKKIEKLEPIKRGKWILHPDWISKERLLTLLKQ